MKKEQAIKVTVTRYYDPSEVDIDYSDLLESVGQGDGGFRVTENAKTWLKENMKAVASYDKHCVDEGHIEIEEFLETSADGCELEYLFEVVEFTTDDEGTVTEEVIHVVRDATYDLGELRDDSVVAIEPEDFTYGATRAEEDSEMTRLTVLFYREHGRVPSLREILLMQEASASVALDKGDGSTWSVETRKPGA